MIAWCISLWQKARPGGTRSGEWMRQKGQPHSGGELLTPKSSEDTEGPVYQPPAMLWEEPWFPMALAVSCAFIPGESPAYTSTPLSS